MKNKKFKSPAIIAMLLVFVVTVLIVAVSYHGKIRTEVKKTDKIFEENLALLCENLKGGAEALDLAESELYGKDLENAKYAYAAMAVLERTSYKKIKGLGSLVAELSDMADSGELYAAVTPEIAEKLTELSTDPRNSALVSELLELFGAE